MFHLQHTSSAVSSVFHLQDVFCIDHVYLFWAVFLFLRKCFVLAKVFCSWPCVLVLGQVLLYLALGQAFLSS